MAAELARRPEITVEVGGRYDPEADTAALQRHRLEERIDARRDGSASLETILEALYVETFSAERLDAERARFGPQAAATPDETAGSGTKKKAAEPPPPPPRQGFDAAGFYDALRAQLLEAEPVGEADLMTLAGERADAIVGALSIPGGLDPAHVKIGKPEPVQRKKRGSDLVASEMTMTASD